jgi:hypothetical protein
MADLDVAHRDHPTELGGLTSVTTPHATAADQGDGRPMGGGG